MYVVQSMTSLAMLEVEFKAMLSNPGLGFDDGHRDFDPVRAPVRHQEPAGPTVVEALPVLNQSVRAPTPTGQVARTEMLVMWGTCVSVLSSITVAATVWRVCACSA